jgi:hypothetical protein
MCWIVAGCAAAAAPIFPEKHPFVGVGLAVDFPVWGFEPLPLKGSHVVELEDLAALASWKTPTAIKESGAGRLEVDSVQRRSRRNAPAVSNWPDVKHS